MSLCRVGLAGLARYGNPRLVNMATMRLTRKITSKPVTTGFTDRLTNTNPTYNTASSYHLPFITTNQFKTSVSEMTRKMLHAEAQTALENKRYILWNAGICPITKILWKTASPRKISLESGNQLPAELWPRKIFNMLENVH